MWVIVPGLKCCVYAPGTRMSNHGMELMKRVDEDNFPLHFFVILWCNRTDNLFVRVDFIENLVRIFLFVFEQLISDVLIGEIHL